MRRGALLAPMLLAFWRIQLVLSLAYGSPRRCILRPVGRLPDLHYS